MEERRIMAVRDGRRLPPRNSRGEFRRRRSRRDRGMDYAGEDMRMRDYGDVTRRGRYGDYGEYDMRGSDYARAEMAHNDMRVDYRGTDMGDMARNDYGSDGHHGGMHGGRAGGHEPIEFMGYCSGYYGSPEQDYGMNYRRYGGGYDMRGRGRGRDYGYDYGDYGDDYGDYGETLSDKELEEWNKKLLGQLDEREKQMFSKDAIMQKIKQMGLKMEGFGEKELYTATIMIFTDYKKSIGANPDLAIKLAYEFLIDPDSKLKGADKLCVYHDEVVMGGED